MNNTKNALLFGGVSMILLTVVAISFAYFSPIILSDNSYSISGTVDSSDKPDITLTDTNTGVTLANKYPMKESVALATVTPYNFTVTNNSTTKPVKFDIIMETMYNGGANDLDDTLVRTSFGNLVGYGREVTPTTTGYKKAYVIKTDYLEANASKTYDLRLWIDESADNSNATNKNWTGKIVVSATSRKITSEDTLAALDVAPNTTATPDFAKTSPSDVKGVFAMEDDYGTSYYYRGNITNNYVQFGKYPSDYTKYTFTSSGTIYEYPSLALCETARGTGNCATDTSLAGSDIYWRIVRINGDGSIRMIYDGTSVHANGDVSTDRLALQNVPWNLNNYNDAKYVGYMYGGANGVESTSKAQAQTNETNSNIKNVLDAWYENVFKDTVYEKYISDEVFCNDRSTASEASQWNSNDTTLGYGKNITYFGANSRQYYMGRKPSLECPQKNDAFTQNDTVNGNSALTYPIGLITADELNIGGLVGQTIKSNYLYKNTRYWSLSPSYFAGHADVFHAYYGAISTGNVHNPSAAVPVINLSAESASQLVGSGTTASPYHFE